MCARARVHTPELGGGAGVALFSHLRVGKLTPLFYLDGIRMVSSPGTGRRLSSSNHEGDDGGRLSASLPSTLQERLVPIQSRSGGGRADSPFSLRQSLKAGLVRVGGGGAGSAERGGDSSSHALGTAHCSLACGLAPQTQSAAAVCWAHGDADHLRSPRAVLPAPPGPPPRAPSALQAR